MKRLAHGWELAADRGVPAGLVRDFVRPAVRAVPRTMAARVGFCRIRLVPLLAEALLSSQWTETESGIEVVAATAHAEPHDAALELLLCLGQALWERLRSEEIEAYLRLLNAEINRGVSGEIDEETLREKKEILSSRALARSPRRLARYARASFASTAAEYVHCLWHDVTARSGPEHLPADCLRARLELLGNWFPPDRGYRLFPR